MRFVKTAESIFDIPSGFTRVAYLESTGTQYIDTGFKMSNDNMTFDGNIMWTNKNATANFFFGYRLVNSPVVTGDMRAFFVYGASATPIGRLAIRYGVNADNSTQAISLNTKYNISWDGSNLKINGTTYDTLSQAYTPASYKSMFLFWCNCENTYSADVGKFVGRIYNWQIKQDGVLVRDFIPCIDPLGRACMYDLVEKKAYYNQGTGEFTVGRQIIPVEYLESTGTQYIDTGIAGSASLKIGVICKATAQDKAIIGCGTSPSEERLQIFADVNYYSCRLNNVRTVSNVSTLSKATIVLDVPNKKYTINGTEFEINYTGNLSNRNLYLFNRNVVNDGAYGFQGCIWECWIEENGVLVRDFIPCKDENNVGFMFDNVSGTVYLNAGTGAFIVGGNKYKMKLRLIKDNILPTGYTQVEYLESSGTQYIDTGYKLNSNSSVELDYQLTQASQSRAGLFGALNMSGSNQGRIGSILSPSNSYLEHGYGSGNDYWQQGMPDTSRHVIYQKKNETYFDGVLIHTFNTATFSLAMNAYLGNFVYTNYTPAKAKYYSSRWWDNDTIVRDFIPAIDPSGTPCMYDLVTRTPFYNAGTGTFTTGKPVLPIVRFPVDPIPGYKTVNYLGSDSTAYIDTGVSGANNNLKIEMDFSYSKFYAYGYFFSNYESEQHDTTRFLLDASDNSRGLAYINTKSQNGAIYTPYNLTMNDKHSVIITKTTVSIDGVITTNPSPPVGTANTKNIILFNRGAGSYTDKRDVGMRCWSFKIYDNNTLVRNFIPVVRLLDNKAGMWDTVTKQFYGSLGTGNFNYG